MPQQREQHTAKQRSLLAREFLGRQLYNRLVFYGRFMNDRVPLVSFVRVE